MDPVRLIEPNGTEGIITTLSDAIIYCKSHPGWLWRYLTDEELSSCI